VCCRVVGIFEIVEISWASSIWSVDRSKETILKWPHCCRRGELMMCSVFSSLMLYLFKNPASSGPPVRCSRGAQK
jgi:hypothetical protein